MRQETIGAVIMIGHAGPTAAEQVLGQALRAAATDLIAALTSLDIHPVVVAGPELDWLPADTCCTRDLDGGPFHFGERLAGVIERFGLAHALYFGAGSAPLLGQEMIAQVWETLLGASGSGERLALTNNLHSSDWVAFTQVQDALPILQRASRDNSLAWMLQEDGGWAVSAPANLPPSARLDLDTPADLAIVRAHPACSPRLRAALEDSLLERIPVGVVLDVLARDGSRAALIGRVAPQAWDALSRAAQCWIRVFSEERGMAASERLARGEARSLVERMIARWGPGAFFEDLAQVADAAIIDSRVLMAAAGHYPGAGERFASDLYLPDAIHDPWLREFTAAAQAAPLPVLLGGHGVVAGGLHALAEIVAERRTR
ncbi:MAG: hypothetical protein M5U29_02830 [Anaerolineae bacterium]|nr:hypothetical protein [Anaerolineae bacterium]